MGPSGRMISLIIFFGLGHLPLAAHAEIDGHGPDAWRVTGVAADDVLNARMGPGTNYPVIETFAHDERGMQQITCVPFFAPGHYMATSQAQIDALAENTKTLGEIKKLLDDNLKEQQALSKLG